MAKVTHTILPPYQNTDLTAISSSMWKIQDGIILFGTPEKKVSLKRRPGLKPLFSLGTGKRIDGEWWSNSYQCWFVISDSRLFKVTDSAGSFTEIALSGTVLQGESVVFAECFDVTASETKIFFANGGQINWTNGTIAGVVAGDIAPARCTHVAQADTYLVFNDLDTPGYWKHSAEAEPTNMTAGQARTMAAQRIPDAVLAVFVKGGKVFVCGNRSIELFQNTGDSIPFASLGVTVDTGLMNKDSFAMLDEQFLFFNQNRQLMVLNGYVAQSVSEAYQTVFDSLGAVVDLRTQFISSIGGRQYFIMNFNDQSRTIVYDVTNGCFYEWGSWSGNSYDMFLGGAYCYAKPWGQHLIGSRVDDTIYLLSPDQYTDGGNVIKTSFEFGRQDHGSSSFKMSQTLFLSIKRGAGLTSDPISSQGYAFLSFRDDGSMAYGTPLEIDLGKQGDTVKSSAFHRMGRYRDRQLKIEIGDDTDFLLNGIEEEVYDTGRL